MWSAPAISRMSTEAGELALATISTCGAISRTVNAMLVLISSDWVAITSAACSTRALR